MRQKFKQRQNRVNEKGFNRLADAYKLSKNLEGSSTSSLDIKSWKKACYDAMNDDFNTPILIAQLFEAVRFINLVNDKKETKEQEKNSGLENSSKHIYYIMEGMDNCSKINLLCNLPLQI